MTRSADNTGSGSSRLEAGDEDFFVDTSGLVATSEDCFLGAAANVLFFTSTISCSSDTCASTLSIKSVVGSVGGSSGGVGLCRRRGAGL